MQRCGSIRFRFNPIILSTTTSAREINQNSLHELQSPRRLYKITELNITTRNVLQLQVQLSKPGVERSTDKSELCVLNTAKNYCDDKRFCFVFLFSDYSILNMLIKDMKLSYGFFFLYFCVSLILAWKDSPRQGAISFLWSR